MSDSVSDFQYYLPQRLIARYPARERSASRLLCLDGSSGAIEHRRFSELSSLLFPGDLLVFNDTRVIPARLVASKRGSGGRVEILVERILSDDQILAQLKASRPPRPGTLLDLNSGENAPRFMEVLGRERDFFRLRLADGDVTELLESFGHMPLPPYLDREDEALDRERYQTIYARVPGAVAAPTAGLHFDRSLLEQLTARGVRQAWVTLHVGAGTFRPVRCERIEDHQMHAELVDVQSSVCELVHDTYRRGGRVVAVGTTSVRCLEAAAAGGRLEPMRGDTDIFIYPPYRFRVVDAMITNFHLPESTLLMLVSAFAGREQILAAYEEAIRSEYRFFSYGDAMFISAASKPLLRERLD